MPDPSPTVPPTPTPSPLPGGETTSASPPTSTPPAPAVWRAGDDAPAWARGKTGPEIVAFTQQLADSVARPNAPAPVQQGTQPMPIDPSAYATGQDIINAQNQAVSQFAPQMQRFAEQNAALMYRQVQTDPRFTDVFQKYGPEVSGYLGRIPKEQWTVDILEGAAKLVKADHLDELARERADRIIQGMEPTIRPTGGGTTPVQSNKDLTLQSDKLPPDWAERAKKVGLDERTLDEFCFANGISRADFFKTFEKGLIVEVGKVKGV